jgi:hypothetical protein
MEEAGSELKKPREVCLSKMIRLSGTKEMNKDMLQELNFSPSKPPQKELQQFMWT